jgi:hypothetical protein
MRKATKRKVWDTNESPLKVAIRNVTVFSGADLSRLQASELVSLSSLASGRGTATDWVCFCDVSNVSEVMAKAGIGVEVIPVAALAQVALAEMYMRWKATKQWGATPDEAAVLRELYAYHDLQRQSVTRGEYVRHMKTVKQFQKTSRARTPQQIHEEAQRLLETNHE